MASARVANPVRRGLRLPTHSRPAIDGRDRRRRGRRAVHIACASLLCAAPAAGQGVVLPRDTLPATGNAKWNGWYAGGQFGFSHGTAASTLSDPNAVSSHSGFGRLDGGLHLGYNGAVSSRLILGVEADASFPNFLEDGAIWSRTTPQGSVVTETIDFVTTLRARFGYTIGRALIYGTGGLAPSETRFIESSADFDHQIARWRLGWAAGLGAAIGVAPGWVARVEYLYGQLGQTGATFPSSTNVESKTDIASLRFGLSRVLGGPASNAASTTPANATRDTAMAPAEVGTGSLSRRTRQLPSGMSTGKPRTSNKDTSRSGHPTRERTVSPVPVRSETR